MEQLVKRAREGVTVQIAPVDKTQTEYRGGGDQRDFASGSGGRQHWGGDKGWKESCVVLVFACPADVALRILGWQASFWERWVLGSVEYYKDLSVTHCDQAYVTHANTHTHAHMCVCSRALVLPGMSSKHERALRVCHVLMYE